MAKEDIVGATMANKLADRLREDIFSRKLEPGSRITVKEISDRYGVSSMPVREAINMLCGEQLLQMNPYKGATVLAITSDLVVQLNELQMALESLLVELCMKKGYPDELLEQLQQINDEMLSLEDEQSWKIHRNRLNVKFHTLEYSLCSEHVAYGLFIRTLNQLATIRKYHEVEIGRARQTAEEHSQIIDVLRRKDVKGAIEITRKHVYNSKQHVLLEEFG
ncbi:GntR family transcriptional regulator [Chakrabartyella piscis]|uniref:GntR family transcriptional regulator n=1 Tax=Chakrabartyella piscis TaxID=2918914 RepID=UPI0029584A47|nr:GntR family transcriptional regulator [Chakrabartyella piscis]